MPGGDPEPIGNLGDRPTCPEQTGDGRDPPRSATRRCQSLGEVALEHCGGVGGRPERIDQTTGLAWVRQFVEVDPAVDQLGSRAAEDQRRDSGVEAHGDQLRWPIGGEGRGRRVGPGDQQSLAVPDQIHAPVRADPGRSRGGAATPDGPGQQSRSAFGIADAIRHRASIQQYPT